RVVALAVAADREAAVLLVDLGGGRPVAPLAGELRLRVLRHGNADARARELFGEPLHDALELVDAVLLAERHVRGHRLRILRARGADPDCEEPQRDPDP